MMFFAPNYDIIKIQLLATEQIIDMTQELEENENGFFSKRI